MRRRAAARLIQAEVSRELVRLEFGQPVQSTDGLAGHLVGIRLQPPTWRVTHLVVRELHRHGLERLLPIKHADLQGTRVEFLGSATEFGQLEFSEGVPIQGDSPASGSDQSPGIPILDDKRITVDDTLDDRSRVYLPTDRLLGRVHLRVGANVTSSDGRLGTLQGLVIRTPDSIAEQLMVDRTHHLRRQEAMISVGSAEARGDDVHVAVGRAQTAFSRRPRNR